MAMLTKYIHAGNITAYLDMKLIENKFFYERRNAE